MTLTLEHPWALLLAPAVLALAFWAQRQGRRFLSAARLAAVRVLRPVLLGALVLALAGLTAERREKRLTVIFAVDGSRSVGGAGHPETVRRLKEAAERIPEGDQAGVVVFGREAMIDTFPTESFRVAEVLGRPDDQATDLGAAVRLSRGLFPPSRESRLVLVTDGVETAGAVEQAIAALPPGIDVVWAPLDPPGVSEVLIEQVSVPERIVEGQPHRVRVVVRSSGGTEATLRLFRGSTPVAAARVRLEPGRSQVYTFEQTASGGGALLYRARIETDEDSTPENNQAAALVRVEGRPSILAVDREPRALAPFVRALERSGMRVDAAGPGALPSDVGGLAAYDAVILSDVGAHHFSPAQLEALGTWVEDLGGGLVMLGGPESFGRGGYWRTPVEDVLPLSMEVKDRSYFPSVGLVLAIDKSGSMAGSAGVEKIEMAKSAAAEVVDLLQPIDRIGVIAFDAAAKWVVPLASAEQRDAIVDKLGTLRAGGGTDAYPAMELAHAALLEAETRVKHVLVLTDGQLAGRDHEGLAGKMLDDGITVSTVAVGTDADLFTLERIADAGGGTYYHTVDMESLPRVFLRDAFRVARSWIVEETFQPVLRETHPALAGVRSLPSLDGYVAASEKPAARHLLGTHRGDPLLSLWRVGLGKSAAFTSDVKARWAGRWLGWPGYEAFWASLVRWVVRDPAEGRLRASASASDGRLRLAADLLDGQGAFVNGARLVARVVSPGGRSIEVPLTQTGPGRYTAEASASEEGPYLAAVLRDDEKRPGAPNEAALVTAVVPYADEFRGLSSTPHAMERLVETGRIRRLESADALFEHRGTGGRITRPLFPWLLAATTFLLVSEVAVRKLALPRWLERRLAGRPREKVRRTSDDPQMRSLQAARRRATARVRREADVVEAPSWEAPSAVEVEAETPERAPGPSTREASKDGDAYTSRLLEAKKRMRRRR